MEDGSWAMVDPDSKMVELAPDLLGNGASEHEALEVRGALLASPHPLGDDSALPRPASSPDQA